MRIFQQQENADELMTEVEHQGLSTKRTFSECKSVTLIFWSYLAGINSSLVPPSAEHGWPNPAQVVLITGFRGQDGHIHLLESVNSRAICGTKLKARFRLCIRPMLC